MKAKRKILFYYKRWIIPRIRAGECRNTSQFVIPEVLIGNPESFYFCVSFYFNDK